MNITIAFQGCVPSISVTNWLFANLSFAIWVDVSMSF